MKGVIYARYSPGPQQTEQSIEGQVRECMKYAEANNISIINTYADRKQTGRNDNRAQFQKMLQDSKRQAFDVVIVWKIDRFGRNREEMAKNKAVLRLNGVRVLSACEHIPDGPEGIILESVLEGLAEYYSANLSQNIVRGMRESALKCQHNGSGLALGFSVDKEHKYHIDPETAPIVQLIYKKYDEGEHIPDIVRYLNDNGIQTLRGNAFTHYGITRILKNRLYIGEYRWRDVVVPDGVPRIIDDDLFERVQKRLSAKKKAPAVGRGAVDFLLTGKVFCGLCHDTMAGDSGTGKNGERHFYYSCRTKKQRHGCKKKSVQKEWLENEVTKITVQYVLHDDIISYIADRVIEIQEKEHADKSMLNYYTEQLKETVKSIANIMKAIEAGIITKTTRDRLLELEAERDNLEIEIEKEKIVRPRITREQVVYFINRFKDGDIEDKEYQSRLIETFVNKVILYDDKIIITYNYTGGNDPSEIEVDMIEEAALEQEESVRLCPPRVHHSLTRPC